MELPISAHPAMKCIRSNRSVRPQVCANPASFVPHPKTSAEQAWFGFVWTHAWKKSAAEMPSSCSAFAGRSADLATAAKLSRSFFGLLELSEKKVARNGVACSC